MENTTDPGSPPSRHDLEDRTALMMAERDVLELIARDAPLARTLEAIVDLVERQARGVLASILLVDDQGCLRLGAAPSLPTPYNRAVEGLAIGPTVGCCGTAAFRKQTVITADIASDPLWAQYRDLALPHGLAACWSVPLLAGDGRVLGTLAHYYRRPQEPGPKDLELTEIARHLAEIAIERKQAGVALQQSKDELERRVAERTTELRASEALLRAVVDHTPDAIYIKDLSGRYLMINGAAAANLGRRVEEVTGRRTDELIEAASARVIRAHDRAVVAGGVSQTFEETLVVGGEERVFLSTKFPYRSAEGEIVGLVGISRDITKQVRRERVLKEAQGLAHMGSWEWDVPRNEVRWSDELYRIYGVEPGAFVATFEAFLGQIRADDRERVRRAIEAAMARGGSFSQEEHIVRPSGEERVLASSGRVELNEAGEPVRLWGICIDITERKRAEEEVLELNATLERRVEERTRQLEATNRELEAFSYSVSHDLRAPLRGLDGFSRILLDEYAACLDEPGRDYLRRVRAASQRMGQLIDDLLELSRLTRGALGHGQVDLSRIAREVADGLRALAPHRQVALTIQDGLVVEGDARLLRVAIENLLNNAWKFTSRHAKARIAFGAEVQGGRQEFYVRDDGAGFDMAHADGLFEPFVRLHRPEEFEGTGVGLATVQRIVHRHGGRIWAEAAPERGATFRFTLHEGPSV
jgi:PAS domain S-box-containing protein